MPPWKRARPDARELAEFTGTVGAWLTEFDQQRIARQGRATLRRLNRFEYENALRDLLHAPWLQVKDFLPEDGVAHRFNKSGDALDVSYVEMGCSWIERWCSMGPTLETPIPT